MLYLLQRSPGILDKTTLYPGGGHFTVIEKFCAWKFPLGRQRFWCWFKLKTRLSEMTDLGGASVSVHLYPHYLFKFCFSLIQLVQSVPSTPGRSCSKRIRRS